MSLRTLAYIEDQTGKNIDRVTRQLKNGVLSHLRALLIIPDDQDDPIRFLHSSIVDYLSDPSRCVLAGVPVDAPHHSARIAQRCIETLVLGQNLSMHIPDKVELLNEEQVRVRAEEHISLPLRYMSRHWTDFVLRVDPTSLRVSQSRLDLLLHQFALKNLLGWIEAMASTGDVDMAASMSSLMEDWFTQAADHASSPESAKSRGDVADLFRDIRQLIATCHYALSPVSPNLYHTLLCSLPTETRLYSIYSKDLPQRVSLIRGVKSKLWSPCIWTARHGRAVSCISLSKDGGHLAVGGGGGTLRVWSTATWREEGAPVDLGAREVRGMAFGSSGTIFAVTDTGVVVRWRNETGEKYGLMKSKEEHGCFAVSPDGGKVVAGFTGEAIYLWDEGGDKPPRKLEGHSGWVQSVAFSPDGALIASGAQDQTIRLWDVASGAQKGKPLVGHLRGVNPLAWSPDARSLVSGSRDRTIRMWDSESGAEIWRRDAYPFCTSVAFSQDGHVVASGLSNGIIQLWDAKTGTVKGSLTGHSRPVTSLVFTDSCLISGSLDGTIHMWDLAGAFDLTDSQSEDDLDEEAIAFSPDLKTTVTLPRDRTLRLWDATTGEAKGAPLEGHTTAVTCVAFSLDSQWLASGDSGGVILLRDTASRTAVDPIRAHSSSVRCLAFSPDGTRFVSTSQDGTLRQWDTRTRQPIGGPLSGSGGDIVFGVYSATGRHLLSVSARETIILWDAVAGTRLDTPNPLQIRTSHWTYAAAFASDESAVILHGYSWDVRDALGGKAKDAIPISDPGVVFRTMQSDITVPLWIDGEGWIRLAGNPFLWFPLEYGWYRRCWWRRGIIAIINYQFLMILDARGVPLR